MTQAYKTLLIDTPSKAVVLVTLNRPEVSNAFNTQMAMDLSELFEAFSNQTQVTRAIVVTGAGSKAFCAGGDLKERNGMSDEIWRAQHLVYERMARAVIGCPIPTIGAINGAAYGGGCELTAAFDFAYAARTAKFAQTEVKLGIIPGAGGTQTLSRAVGDRRAKELILTGQVFSAEQAHRWGLINAVYEPEKLLDAVLKTANLIASNAPIAVRQAKRAIHAGLHLEMAEALKCEIEAYNQTVPTKDRREGVAAFNEKRIPKFTGK